MAQKSLHYLSTVLISDVDSTKLNAVATCMFSDAAHQLIAVGKDTSRKLTSDSG
jgi:hypothetical protein